MSSLYLSEGKGKQALPKATQETTDLSPDPVVDSGLRAAYNALANLQRDQFYDRKDIAESLGCSVRPRLLDADILDVANRLALGRVESVMRSAVPLIRPKGFAAKFTRSRKNICTPARTTEA